ncbi:hypothetical protein [Paenibacillus sp. sgz5001063]|uniref:hypothetical protein n=1 Tax=Paenibacillus sp. sgz5001063 TaxID=3242474 RepID=UPI0036D38202
MRVAGTVPRARGFGFSGRVRSREMHRRNSLRHIAEREAVLVVILFLLLIVVLLYFT